MIGCSCKLSNEFRRAILIIRFLLGNLKIHKSFCFNLLCEINSKNILKLFRMLSVLSLRAKRGNPGLLNFLFWWFVAGVTPDLIPNSEVKPCSADDTLSEGESS